MINSKAHERLSQSPVIPIIIPGVSFHSVDEAIEVAKAVKNGGVPILEILMRGNETQQQLAADAIRAIRNHAETSDITICAGTVNETEKMDRAVGAGVDLMVSADAKTEVTAHWQQHYSHVPFAPSGVTTTEITNLFSITPLVKLFPINQFANKTQYLNSLTTLYGHKGSLILSYDATEPENIIDLQHPIVAGIAAAWMTSAILIQDKKWDKITKIAALTIVAAEQARKKQFVELRKSITELRELANIEPAHKDQAVQTDELLPVLEGYWTRLFSLRSTTSAAPRPGQDEVACCMM